MLFNLLDYSSLLNYDDGLAFFAYDLSHESIDVACSKKTTAAATIRGLLPQHLLIRIACVSHDG